MATTSEATKPPPTLGWPESVTHTAAPIMAMATRPAINCPFRRSTRASRISRFIAADRARSKSRRWSLSFSAIAMIRCGKEESIFLYPSITSGDGIGPVTVRVRRSVWISTPANIPPSNSAGGVVKENWSGADNSSSVRTCSILVSGTIESFGFCGSGAGGSEDFFDSSSLICGKRVYMPKHGVAQISPHDFPVLIQRVLNRCVWVAQRASPPAWRRKQGQRSRASDQIGQSASHGVFSKSAAWPYSFIAIIASGS